jgi:hypothetical protein
LDYRDVEGTTYIVDDVARLKTIKNNLEVLLRYISTEELAAYFEASKFVVCPYRDAHKAVYMMDVPGSRKMVVCYQGGFLS